MARPRTGIDVLVLGAGAAGLATARDLSQAGLRVTVIEARPRLGGRVLTIHDPRSPVPIELGAEFVHGEAPETLEIASAAGLAVLELPDLHELAGGGRFKPMGDFWQIVNRMNKDLKRQVAARGKDFPVSEYLRSARLPGPSRGMLRSFVEGFYAALPERISAKSLAADAEESEADSLEGRQFRIANGNDALMQWLRDALDPDRCDVRLSTVAQAVQWARGRVSVSCKAGDGSELPALSARAAVITLPHAVLKAGALRLDPAIPARQRALGGLETGQIFKVVLRFREAFWDEEEFLKDRRAGFSGDGAGQSVSFLHAHHAAVPTWWTAMPVRAPILTGWAGGVAAESLLADEPQARVERALVALSEILGVPRRALEEQLDAWRSHDWRADPFACGAYSYIGVNGMGAPRALGRPVEGTLFFAGEATNGAQIGTVAGALASGRRAAREALRALK